MDNLKLPNINPLDYPTIKCECGNEIFTPGVIFKDIPGVAVGEKENVEFPIKVFYCSKCGQLSPYDKKLFNQDNKNTVNTSGLII